MYDITVIKHLKILQTLPPYMAKSWVDEKEMGMKFGVAGRRKEEQRERD